MQTRTRSSLTLALTVLACVGPAARLSVAQQPIRIEYAFPQQLPRGQSSVVNVAIQSREAVRAAEIAPAPGVTVSGVKQARPAEISQGMAWWEVTVDVAADAAPGQRSLTLVLPMGRTLPVMMMVPTHVPGISDLKVVPARANPSSVDVLLSATDASGDLGDAPYVWFTIACGGEPLVGVVNGTASAGVVRASIPSPCKPAGGSARADRCDLQLRISDSKGNDSNTLKGTQPCA